MIFLVIFPCMVKDIILRELRLNPHEVRLKETLKNLETRKNSNFLSGWRGPLVMIFGGVGVGQVGQLGVRLVGAGGAMAGSQMGQGQWGQGAADDWGGMGWQGAGGPDGSCWGGGAGGGWWGRRAR